MPIEEFWDPPCSWQKLSQCLCAGSHWNEGELDTPITERNVFGYETLSTHKHLKDRLLCELTVVVLLTGICKSLALPFLNGTS